LEHVRKIRIKRLAIDSISIICSIPGIPSTINEYTALLAIANAERIKQIAIAIHALKSERKQSNISTVGR